MMAADKKNEFYERIQKGIESFRSSEQYLNYVRFAGKFHQYSLNNQILIYQQFPKATHVAGYQQWQKDFKRHVLRGARGITIIAPHPRCFKKGDVLKDPYGNPYLDKFGKPQIAKEDTTLMTFGKATVFDVSQTDGEPIPERFGSISGSVKDQEIVLHALAEVSGCKVTYASESELDGAYGNYYRSTKTINILEGRTGIEDITILAHETAHACYHSTDNDANKSRAIKELEAESTAFMVCEHLGLDTSQWSIPYLESWSDGTVKPEKMKETLLEVHDKAQDIITKIDQTIDRLMAERGIEATKQSLKSEPTEALENKSPISTRVAAAKGAAKEKAQMQERNVSSLVQSPVR